MEISMPKHKLLGMIKKQVNSMYYLEDEDERDIEICIDKSLEKIERCFGAISYKNYNKVISPGFSEVIFNPLHSSQYTIFLYYLANSIYKETSNIKLCDRLYGVTKIMSSAELFYAVDLPDIFFCDHPLGSVMGRANYSNYFSFAQGCTVGNNKGIYPTFDEKVCMMSNSKIIGNCHIGRNVIVSANTYIKDTDIPSNSIVFGQSPDLVIKSDLKNRIHEVFNQIFKF